MRCVVKRGRYLIFPSRLPECGLPVKKWDPGREQRGFNHLYCGVLCNKQTPRQRPPANLGTLRQHKSADIPLFHQQWALRRR